MRNLLHQLVAVTLLGVGSAWYHNTNPLFAADTGKGVELIGRASVVDGDTIEIHGERVRFNGIDAPESAQTCDDREGKAYRCGAQAAKAVDAFLSASSPTRCDFVERDRYGRFVGDCYRADGTSVQAWIVGNGWAMDWRGTATANTRTSRKPRKPTGSESGPEPCSRLGNGGLRAAKICLANQRLWLASPPAAPKAATSKATSALLANASIMCLASRTTRKPRLRRTPENGGSVQKPKHRQPDGVLPRDDDFWDWIAAADHPNEPHRRRPAYVVWPNPSTLKWTSWTNSRHR